jgi:hypothetical protein
MSTSSVVRGDSTIRPRGRFRRSTPQAKVAGAALGFVGLACAWTLYGNLFGAPVEADTFAARVASVAARPAAPKAMTGLVSFAERFEAILAAPKLAAAQPAAPAMSEEKRNYLALLDATYSLGSPPDTFRPTVLAVPDTPKPAPSPADIAAAPDVALPPPARIARATPLPASRPADFKFAQSRVKPGHSEMVERAKNAALAAMAAKTPSLFERLFGGKTPAPGPVLAYAGSDGGVMSDGTSMTPGGSSEDDKLTAIYDISARVVYMPDGSKLEAHSGLGDKLDDPRYAHVRMRGVTPPHIYTLKPREALFHGVAALRLTPVGGEGAIYGRTGLLAHTYMLGPNGDSNGCVSFRDYSAFLKAYQRGEVRRLVVVASLKS